MKVLLLDASSERISFGFSIDGTLESYNELDSENNADLLTYEVKCWFRETGRAFSEIDVVSLSNGPGSFTGLRISSAIAKGISYSLSKKLVEVNSLDILAECASKFNSSRIIVPVISSNMRTGEYYYAEYNINNEKADRVSDYKIDLVTNIAKNALLVSRTDIKDRELIKVLKSEEMIAQNYLTRKKIADNNFADIFFSEPFYMKEFIPIKHS